MFNLRTTLLLPALLICSRAGVRAAPPDVSFRKQIAPILQANCLACHTSKSASGAFDISTFAALRKGGKGGVEIVPGKAAESRLILYVEGKLQPKMPVGGALKPAEIDLLRKWIDAGAKSDDGNGRVSPTVAMPMLAARAPVTALAYSPDGKILAVGTYRAVQFWDAATHAFISTWGGHPDAVRALAYSPDGKRLAAGGGLSGATGEVRIWDTVTAKEIETFGDHTDAVTSVAFSPDGKRIATGSNDKTAKLWAVSNGKLLATLREHADAVWAVAFSPDGKQVVTASADRSVKVWDATTFKRLYSIGAHDDAVYAVAFAPDGKTIATASGDHSAKLWTPKSDAADYVRGFAGQDGIVFAVAFAPDGKRLATASGDKTVRVWTVDNGLEALNLKDGKDWLYAVRFRPDGKEIAASGWAGRVLIWETEKGKLIANLDTLIPPMAKKVAR